MKYGWRKSPRPPFCPRFPLTLALSHGGERGRVFDPLASVFSRGGEGETGTVRGKRDRTRALSITIIFTMPKDAKNQGMTKRARELRRNSSDAELRLWSFLRAPGFAHAKFRRQAPIGRYIVDFVSFKHRLIVEVDGGHHQQADQVVHDANRTRWLESQGFQVLRFWNNEVLTEPNVVQNVIFESIQNRRNLRPFVPGSPSP